MPLAAMDDSLIESLIAEAQAEAEAEAELFLQLTGHADAHAPEPSIRAQGFSVGLHTVPHTGPVLVQAPLTDTNDDPEFDDTAEEAYEPFEPDEPDIDLSHVPSEWEVRSRKQYEETCSNRPFFLGLNILRAALPEPGALCELCENRNACLRCLDCRSQGPTLLCGLCDLSQHPFAHFHRRESFDAGYWRWEAPSVAFSEDGARSERGDTRNVPLVVITSSMHLFAADLAFCSMV